MTLRSRVLLSWSSGKDSAWTLECLRRDPGVSVVGLLTTFNEDADRVAMHAVRRELAEAQARATGLPLWRVPLPSPCPNSEYERRMHQAMDRAVADGVTHVAFGDLHLRDIRAYRERMLEGSGLEPLFPLWCEPADTPTLARTMAGAGLRAILTCVDPGQLSPDFLGATWGPELFARLPAGVDPCGEHGEFHTFCFAGPMFEREVAVRLGERVHRDGFDFVDVLFA